MVETKKKPDADKIQKAAAAALSTPEPSAQRGKVGRPPGKYGPYKKRDQGQAPTAPAQTQPAAQDGSAGEQQEQAAGPIIPGATLRRGIECVFNSILATRRGQHWALEPEEIDELSSVGQEIVQELFPSFREDRWVYRLSIIGLVVTPRVIEDLSVNGSKKQKEAPRKNESQQGPSTHQAQSSPDPRPAGPGQNFLVQVDPSKGYAVGSN